MCGISFKIGSVQGYYSDVTVDGFDHGIDVLTNGEIDPQFEYLTLRHQRSVAIEHDGGVIGLRRVLSDQTSPDVQAIHVEKGGSLTVVLDSEFRNQSSTKPAIELTSDKGQALLARNVVTEGYSAGIVKQSETVAPSGTIEEYVSSPVKTLSPDSPPHTLNLPIEDSPIPPEIAAADWVIVDDVAQLQAALSSGKPGIMLRKHTFEFDDSFNVPASVKVINGMGARFKGKGSLAISEASGDPLFIEDTGMLTYIDAQRDLVQRCGGGHIVNRAKLPITCFVDNVNDIASGNQFCVAGEMMFARSIDIEYAKAEQIVCNGGSMWIFGYKTEHGNSSPFVCRNGGSMEILGGYTNSTAMPKQPDQLKPVITNDNSNVTASLQINLRDWPNVIQERRGDQTFQATSKEFPKRGDSKNNWTMPLYSGFQPAAK